MDLVARDLSCETGFLREILVTRPETVQNEPPAFSKPPGSGGPQLSGVKSVGVVYILTQLFRARTLNCVSRHRSTTLSGSISITVNAPTR